MSLVSASRTHIVASVQRQLAVLARSISTMELGDRQAGRKRVIVLGAGWAATSFVRGLSIKDYQPLIISPRPYFVFTPLLASTAVGTLEPRTALESVRGNKDTEYWEAAVQSIDFQKKELTCTSPLQDWDPNKSFKVAYDKLVISVGAHVQTFNIPGVREHAFFLKETRDAIYIRRRILRCFEEASLPSTTEERKRQLLHFCIVGGGPTGVEFSAELHDLIHDDLARSYPSLIPLVSVSLYDVAPRILSMFDASLAEYASNLFARQGINVHTRRTVTSVERDVLHLKEEGPVKFGMLVWSTGLQMTPLVKELKGVKKDDRAGRIMTDGYLRVLQENQEDEGGRKFIPDVYAMGDCSLVDGNELPATAQVASQQGAWLRKRLNLIAKRGLLRQEDRAEAIVTLSPEKALDQSVAVSPKAANDPEASVGRGFRVSQYPYPRLSGILERDRSTKRGSRHSRPRSLVSVERSLYDSNYLLEKQDPGSYFMGNQLPLREGYHTSLNNHHSSLFALYLPHNPHHSAL